MSTPRRRLEEEDRLRTEERQKKVIPLFKSRGKDPSLPNTYRPVSLLPVVSKVLETLVVRRLHSEIDDT